MKRLLILLFTIFAFTGCIYDDTEENLSTEGSIFPKGTPFKTYTTEEKDKILKKVFTYTQEEGELPKPKYPEVKKEYNKLVSLLIQEERHGNEKATKELNEWMEIYNDYWYKRK